MSKDLYDKKKMTEIYSRLLLFPDCEEFLDEYSPIYSRRYIPPSDRENYLIKVGEKYLLRVDLDGTMVVIVNNMPNGNSFEKNLDTFVEYVSPELRKHLLFNLDSLRNSNYPVL